MHPHQTRPRLTRDAEGLHDSQLEHSSAQLEASEANHSMESQSKAHLQSQLSGSAEAHGRSNLFLTGQPKGYYDLKKMYGR